MPWTKEQKRENARRPEVRAKRYQKAKEKYASDPEYRKKRIAQATAHRTDTKLGWVMSRLRINKH